MPKHRKVVTRSRVIAVTTTAGEIINSHPGRKAIIFSNVSASLVVISPLRGVTTTQGITLDANGGSASFTTINDGTLPALAWHAIGAGNVNIIVLETIEINEEAEEVAT